MNRVGRVAWKVLWLQLIVAAVVFLMLWIAVASAVDVVRRAAR